MKNGDEDELERIRKGIKIKTTRKMKKLKGKRREYGQEWDAKVLEEKGNKTIRIWNAEWVLERKNFRT